MPWAICQAAWVNTGVGGFEQHVRNDSKPWLNKGERERVCKHSVSVFASMIVQNLITALNLD